MNIFVGNLAHSSSEDDLRKEFEAFGVVSKVSILKDKFTGAPRGFGFVEMSSKEPSPRENTTEGAALEARISADLEGLRGGNVGGNRSGGGGWNRDRGGDRGGRRDRY